MMPIYNKLVRDYIPEVKESFLELEEYRTKIEMNLCKGNGCLYKESSHA